MCTACAIEKEPLIAHCMTTAYKVATQGQCGGGGGGGGGQEVKRPSQHEAKVNRMNKYLVEDDGLPD